MKGISAVSIFTIATLCGGWRAAATSHVAAPETRAFVFIYRNDTVGRESFTRNGDSLKGDLYLGPKHVHYEAQFGPTGTISRLDVRTSGAGSGVVDERLTSLIVGRDSAQFIDHFGNNVDSLRVASQGGALPLINPSMALLELIVERARAQKSQTVAIPVLSVDEFGGGSVQVTFVATDTAMIGSGSGRDMMRLSLDAQGHVRGGASGADAKRRYTILPSLIPLSPGK